jgi:hypothetical protein
MTTGALALIILSTILVQVAVLLLVGGYRRRRQYLNLDGRTSEALTAFEPYEPAPSTDQPVDKELSWDGFREFVVQRREFEDGNRSENCVECHRSGDEDEAKRIWRTKEFNTNKLKPDETSRDKDRKYE